MSENKDLKTFYNSTKPTSENISTLFYDLYQNKIYNNKQGFVESSNKTFAMLAHLRAYTLDKDESYRIQRMYSLKDFERLKAIITKVKIATFSTSTNQFDFNPSAVPMVQRYIKIFEAYEKQNGLKSFCEEQSSKEPGDN